MTNYIPLDCNLHDHLEALATLRKRCQIIYRQSDGLRTETVDVIADIYTKNKEEFVVLETGEVIRLDALIKVDGLSFIDVIRNFSCKKVHGVKKSRRSQRCFL